jgi:hypothetical protein
MLHILARGAGTGTRTTLDAHLQPGIAWCSRDNFFKKADRSSFRAHLYSCGQGSPPHLPGNLQGYKHAGQVAVNKQKAST